MGSNTVWAGLAGIVITGLFTFVTQRAAAKAAVRNAELTSRTDIEKEAFERAKGFYTDVIDRQDTEIQNLEGDVTRLRGEVGRLRSEVAEAREELDDTRRELTAAKAVLRLRYPDEP